MKNVRLTKHAISTLDREYEITCKKCLNIFEVKAGQAIYHFDKRGHHIQVACPKCLHFALRFVEKYL